MTCCASLFTAPGVELGNGGSGPFGSGDRVSGGDSDSLNSARS